MNPRTLSRSLLVALGLGIAVAANAQLFTNFNGFDPGNGSAYVVDSNTLLLTSGNSAGGEAGSAFLHNAVNVSGPWTMSFRYTADMFGGFGPADGITFVIQNSANGTLALGGSGSDLGYGGINNSVAIALNIWEFSSPNGRGTQLFENGNVDLVNRDYIHTDPVDLTLPVDVTLAYDGSVLTEILSQGTNSFSLGYTIDLASVIGSSSAFVGFTGADGSGVSRQRISFGEPTPEPFTTALGLAAAGAFVRRRMKKTSAQTSPPGTAGLP